MQLDREGRKKERSEEEMSEKGGHKRLFRTEWWFLCTVSLHSGRKNTKMWTNQMSYQTLFRENRGCFFSCTEKQENSSFAILLLWKEEKKSPFEYVFVLDLYFSNFTRICLCSVKWAPCHNCKRAASCKHPLLKYPAVFLLIQYCNHYLSYLNLQWLIFLWLACLECENAWKHTDCRSRPWDK